MRIIKIKYSLNLVRVLENVTFDYYCEKMSGGIISNASTPKGLFQRITTRSAKARARANALLMVREKGKVFPAEKRNVFQRKYFCCLSLNLRLRKAERNIYM